MTQMPDTEFLAHCLRLEVKASSPLTSLSTSRIISVVMLCRSKYCASYVACAVAVPPEERLAVPGDSTNPHPRHVTSGEGNGDFLEQGIQVGILELEKRPPQPLVAAQDWILSTEALRD